MEEMLTYIQDELIITVEARDNWKSSLPGMDSFNTGVILGCVRNKIKV